MSIADRLRLDPGERVELKKHDPADAGDLRDDEAVAKRLAENLERMRKLQYKLYAEGKRALLIVLQGMDASGKDGVVRHVIAGFNPQGCRVTAFKSPTPEELSHDFLWRIHRAVPPRGEIGVFNRSHYEDVLIVRVKNLVPKEVWSQRYEQINEFEELLDESGVRIVKIFLHVSKDEQLKRLKARVEDPEKRWKMNPGDFAERELWDEYEKAFEAVLEKCSSKRSPWYVVPADKKWFRDLAVSQVVVDALEEMDPRVPQVTVDWSTSL